MNISKLLVLTVLPALTLAACASAPDDSCQSDRRLSANGVSVNRLAANRLSANGLLGESLPEVPLTSGSIAEALPAEAFADDFTQSVLEYMVGCALAPEQSIQVTVGGELRTYAGSLGLAPQWGTEHGECDGECQGWVSACLIARTNFEGVSMQISLLGDAPGLAPSAEESAEFDIEEATYFGDLFGEGKSMYACVPAGSDGPLRTCGEDPSTCPIKVLGDCEEVCDADGCSDPNGIVHSQTITVNIRDTAASCE